MACSMLHSRQLYKGEVITVGVAVLDFHQEQVFVAVVTQHLVVHLRHHAAGKQTLGKEGELRRQALPNAWEDTRILNKTGNMKPQVIAHHSWEEKQRTNLLETGLYPHQ